MPLTISPNKFYAKDPNGNGYLSANVISDQTTAEMVARIQAKADEVTSQLASAGEVEGMLSGTFSSSTNYVAGQYVIQSVTVSGNTVNKLFRFTADHPAGAWTGTDAVEVKLSDDVGSLKSAFSLVGSQTVINGVDDTDYTDNGYWNPSGGGGAFVPNNSYKAYNKYIPVKPNTVYTCWRYANNAFSLVNTMAVYWYKADKSAISGQAYRSDYTSPANAAFLRLSAQKGLTYLVKEGTEAPTKYVTYSVPFVIDDDVQFDRVDDLDKEIEALSTDLYNTVTFEVKNGVDLTDVTDNGYWNPSGGSFVPNNAYAAGNKYIPVKPGKIYSVWYQNSSGVILSATSLSVCWYDSNKTFISGASGNSSYTAPNNAAYVRVSFQKAYRTIFKSGESAPTEYVPYTVGYYIHDDVKYPVLEDRIEVLEDNKLTEFASGDCDTVAISSKLSEVYVPSVIIDGKGKHGKTNRILAINHDDFNKSDYVGTRKIYEKYGFNGNFNFILRPFATVNAMNETVENAKKLLKNGNGIGLHAYFARSAWWGNKMFDVRPNGTFTFAPTLAQVKGQNGDGTGTNSFGDTITASTTFADIGYAGETSIVASCTADQYKDIIKKYCVYYINSNVTGIDLDGESATYGILYWAEYWYNNLIDSTLGYTTDIATDYSIPSGESAEDYYPDAAHIKNGKMVYWDDTENPHYSDSDYQKVGMFTSGLFKGCFTCCNFEVTDRIIKVAEAFCQHYFGMEHFNNFGRHGQGYVEKYWINNGVAYDDSAMTILTEEAQPVYRSAVKKFMSNLDILLSNHIKMTNHYGPFYDLATFVGQIGLYYGQNSIRGNFFNACIYPYGRTTFLTLLGNSPNSYNDFIPYNVVNGLLSEQENPIKWAYENATRQVGTNGDNPVYMTKYVREAIETIRAAAGTRKIPCLSLDTVADSPNTMAAIELLCQFCWKNDITIVNMEEAREIATIRNDMPMNLMPNPAFNQMLINMWGSSTVGRAYIPDGWAPPYDVSDGTYEVTTEVIDGVSYRAFSFTGGANTQSLFTPVYGLPGGKYRFTAKAKSGNLSASMIGIGLALNGNGVAGGGRTTGGGSASATTEYSDVSIEVDIPEPYYTNERLTAKDIICNGYAQNVAFIKINLNAEQGKTTVLVNPRLEAV